MPSQRQVQVQRQRSPKRKVFIEHAHGTWFVKYLERDKGQWHSPAQFNDRDSSEADVVAWVKQNPKLELVDAPVVKWDDAAKLLKRDADDSTMERIKVSDGTPVFVKRNGEWVPNVEECQAAFIGLKLAQGFHGENGGQVSNRTIAMMALAVDEDKAYGIEPSEVEILTAGYEHDSEEMHKQEKLGEKYQIIHAAITSFF